MNEVLPQRALEEVAAGESIEELHGILDQLWTDAAFVPALHRMAFSTAVIEAASTVVQHGVPAQGATLVLGVDLTVCTGRLSAVIREIGAEPIDPLPDLDPPAGPASPDDGTSQDDESGREPAMIRALVTTVTTVTTVTVERQDDADVWVLSRDSG